MHCPVADVKRTGCIFVIYLCYMLLHFGCHLYGFTLALPYFLAVLQACFWSCLPFFTGKVCPLQRPWCEGAVRAQFHRTCAGRYDDPLLSVAHGAALSAVVTSSLLSTTGEISVERDFVHAAQGEGPPLPTVL